MSHLNYDFVLDLPFCHLNDDSFNLAMYELTRGSLNYDNDGLDSLIFNPINQTGIIYLLVILTQILISLPVLYPVITVEKGKLI